jgi:antitoxin MazE
VDEGRVVIEPLADAPLTLAQRLARFDPQVHAGEAMATGQSVGVEAW